MEIYQLKTFVAVAREGSITRVSERLHLSQPAISAHIKALEDVLGLVLFDRTSRGMRLTSDGQRLLAKAEETLFAHQELMDEATRLKGRLVGKLRLGAGSNSNHAAVGTLLAFLSERCPDVEVVVQHGSSLEILAALRNGSIDAGIYNESGVPDPELTTLEVSQFRIHLAAPLELVAAAQPLNWQALAEQPWIYPAGNSCCGQTAESLFKQHQIRPKRVISVDRESVTRTLIASRIGVGLLHSDTAKEAQARGELALLFECQTVVRVLFAHLTSRAQDPLLNAATSILRTDLQGRAPVTR